MLIDAGKVVRLGLTVLDDEGQKIQIDSSTLDVIVGFGQLLPKVEQAIIGQPVGGRCRLELEPFEAFGEYDESKVIEFYRDEFPSDVAAGDLFEAESERDGVVSLKVLEVGEEHLTVDLNHVLAGKSVTIEFDVISIRPADKLELEAAEKRQANVESSSPQQLLSANSLLSGRPRR